MNNRKLVAALACRNGGKRLYGKPVQNLDLETELPIIEYIIQGLLASKVIDNVVLGIAEGDENHVFIDIAQKYDLDYVVGSESDVLSRLIKCGLISEATDIFRITTECPFLAWEYLDRVWDAHLTNDNDVTVTDYLAEGLNYEIYKMSVLQESHAKGNEVEKSEFCSLYVRNHVSDFKVEIIRPKDSDCRLDQRLTVDYPEDLVLCRFVYSHLKRYSPHIPVAEIVRLLDEHPEVMHLVDRFVDKTPVWASIL